MLNAEKVVKAVGFKKVSNDYYEQEITDVDFDFVDFDFNSEYVVYMYEHINDSSDDTMLSVEITNKITTDVVAYLEFKEEIYFEKFRDDYIDYLIGDDILVRLDAF